MPTTFNPDNICNRVAIGNSKYVFENDDKIKNNLCKPMLKSLCDTEDDTGVSIYNDEAYDYYLKCIDKDNDRNEFKDINNIKYKYDKIKQQNIDNDLRKKSNELFNYLIIFFIVLFLIIIFAIIKFLKF